MGSNPTKHPMLTEEQRAKLLELLDPTEIIAAPGPLETEPRKMMRISISAHLQIEPQFIAYADQLLFMLRSTVLEKIDEKIAKAQEIQNAK